MEAYGPGDTAVLPGRVSGESMRKIEPKVLPVACVSEITPERCPEYPGTRPCCKDDAGFPRAEPGGPVIFGVSIDDAPCSSKGTRRPETGGAARTRSSRSFGTLTSSNSTILQLRVPFALQPPGVRSDLPAAQGSNVFVPDKNKKSLHRPARN